MNVLTASSRSKLAFCPRAYWLAYEQRLRAVTPGDALRFGSAWHAAMEIRARGFSLADAFARTLENHVLDPVLAATLSGLMAGYWDRYAADGHIVLPEVEFRYALSRGRGAWWAAGKLDGIIEMPHCQLIEYKTASADLSDGSEYWLRLRGNPQILDYVLGARALGYDPASILYDVVRKPGIRPKQEETPEQYGDRLAEDCKERPDFYFARREVPILEDEIAQHAEDRKGVCRIINVRRKLGAWERNVGERTCTTCEFAGPCLSGWNPKSETPPAGFRTAEKEHEELQ